MNVRGPSGRFVASLDQAELDAEAAELRSRGLPLREVAERQGVSITTAWERINRALSAVRREGGEQAQALELDKLDRLERRLTEVLERRHVVVSQGHVVTLDGEPLADDDPAVRAAAGLLRVSESRRKLLGLDAPVAQVLQLERRNDAESDAVAEALLAAVDALQLPHDLRVFALETAAWSLGGRQGAPPERPAVRTALPPGVGAASYTVPPPQPPAPVVEQFPPRGEDWAELSREQRAAGGLTPEQLAELDALLGDDDGA